MREREQADTKRDEAHSDGQHGVALLKRCHTIGAQDGERSAPPSGERVAVEKAE